MDEIRLGVAKIVDDAIVATCKDEKPRTYLGGSQLGEQCDRRLWYKMYRPKPVEDPRVWRIFRNGDAVEDMVVEWLRMAGLTIWEKDENGEQFGFVDEMIAGHYDGVITGLPESTQPHLLEIKSAKASRYKAFVKNGCQAESMEYYVQMQVYMKYAQLDRALFVVYNKDTSELYFERIKYDESIAEYYIGRGKDIVCNELKPERAYNDKKYYKCRFCDHSEECWAVD